MNYVNFLVAMAAICVLIVPAFSMPDDGMGKETNQMPLVQDNVQKTCGCQNSMMGQDGKQMPQGQDNAQKTCGCQKSMMGPYGKQMPLVQDNAQKTCGCEKSMMGQYGKQMPQGPDNAQQPCGPEKSMMGGQDGNKMGHKNVKSMMGDREKGGNVGVKLVVINIHV
jgi:hypothetical protein